MENNIINEEYKFKILIIEDSEIHSEWLKEMIKEDTKLSLLDGYSNGKDGLSAAREYQPDLVLLDFKLTDITGLEVAKKLKIYVERIKVFMITAHTEPFIIKRIILG